MGRGARGSFRGRSSKEIATKGDRGSLKTRAFDPSASNGFPREWRGKANNQPHFSLEQEAQNTERHQSWGYDMKLRHANVAFVSIGQSTIDELVNPVLETERESGELLTRSFTPGEVLNGTPMAQLSPQGASQQEIQDVIRCDPINTNNRLQPVKENELAKGVSEMESNKIFFIDVNRAKEPIYTDIPPPTTRRSHSPEMSDSSEEIIVFSGRARGRGGLGSNGSFFRTLESRSQLFKDSVDPRAHPRDDSMAVNNGSTSLRFKNELTPQLASRNLVSHRELYALEPIAHSRSSAKNSFRRKAHEDEIIADYIANMDVSENLTDTVNEEPDVEPHKRGVSSQIEEVPVSGELSQHDSFDWDVSNLVDLPNLDYLSEDQNSLGGVISKRERRSSIQYLVLGEGNSVDDARWKPLSSLKTPGAKRHIRTQESKSFAPDEYLTDSDESNDDLRNRQAAMDLQQGSDDLLDEPDLLDGSKRRMTDENIARLLSKQEELGLGSGNLLLYDGQDYGEKDQVASLRNVTHDKALQIGGRKKYRSSKNVESTSSFTNILNGDPYDGFDVMDLERPSLRKKPKGRRGAFALELADIDVDTDDDHLMQLAWENDRAKKKIRKQKREELRTQGLLGKKNGTDIKTKYAKGISMADLKYEIREFLSSNAESLALPPMDREARKTVHEIANVVKLKSNSIGCGKSRSPVLHKTSRTEHCDSNGLDALDAKMSGRWVLPRRDKGLSKGYSAIRKARGGGFSKAAASYQEGEIVGAAAPELGQENKGRAMLERMGWSTGTALGAINNKGIMQPVAHVVKTTKAGLG